MREIPAYADAFGIGFIRGARRTGVLVAEGDVAIDEIADRCTRGQPAVAWPKWSQAIWLSLSVST